MVCQLANLPSHRTIYTTIHARLFPQWHDRAWHVRQLFFLLLPIILHILPYNYHPLTPLMSLPPTLRSFETTLASLQVLENVRMAAMRDEELRGNVGRYWAHEAKEANEVRGNEDLADEAARLGMGYGRGDTKLSEAAKNAVNSWAPLFSSRQPPQNGI